MIAVEFVRLDHKRFQMRCAETFADLGTLENVGRKHVAYDAGIGEIASGANRQDVIKAATAHYRQRFLCHEHTYPLTLPYPCPVHAPVAQKERQQ